MIFHETNNISWNFTDTTLGFCEVAKYFVDFQFCFRYFQKMTAKFWFRLNRSEISKFQTWQWWKLKKSIPQLLTATAPPLPAMLVQNSIELVSDEQGVINPKDISFKSLSVFKVFLYQQIGLQMDIKVPKSLRRT